MFCDKAMRTLRTQRTLCLLIVGGSFGLREFTQIRYDAQHLKRTVNLKKKKKETKKQNISFHLFSLWQKIKDEKFEDWKNIRGPRPWEDSKSFQYQHRDPEFSKNP
uniref:Cytochrome c oxidase assembly protein COX16 homolog, mitochondrial n=1 Tax=Leptobrachium leishanense TaxID=445787 RepID=A0A8C5W709_9ANUR